MCVGTYYIITDIGNNSFISIVGEAKESKFLKHVLDKLDTYPC